MSSKVICIVQARMSSRRFPGKVLEPIGDQPMIIFQLKRLQKSKIIDKLILATSEDFSDNNLANIVLNEGFNLFRGSLNNVLFRYYKCALSENADSIIRVTGDCPLIDPDLISEIFVEFKSKGYDYLSNSQDGNNLSVPDGFDIEVFKFSLLEKAIENARLESEKEHVTPWFVTKEANAYWAHYIHKPKRKFFRLTVDEPIDLEVINDIFKSDFLKESDYKIDSVIKFLDKNPQVSKKNSHIIRNQGYIESLKKEKKLLEPFAISGQELWGKAIKVIPGGNMLLSKRSEMFLPKKWPSYFAKAKGCFLWDLKGEKYTDMIMAVGTNLLGYCNKEVDEEVISKVNLGSMSTLNCPEEVQLAEKLVNLHPWSDMVRFARSGGEANAIAIRIARAATGKDKVAICGYHGWHDWYLSANLSKKDNLKEHLLEGLETSGVPKSLSGFTIPFKYNDFEEINNIVQNNDLAAIKMEVQRSKPPLPNYLESIKNLCRKNGIVLIFDECTSGFRETFGGLHKKYNIEPDMAMFGKALGNGYPITAIIGREEIMEAAQRTFISSTFWTERIGPSAAIKTLQVMKNIKSWDLVTKNGRYLSNGWLRVAKENDIEIELYGIDPLIGFNFKSKNHLIYKTIITQEMLKRGYLASTVCYLSISHTPKIIDKYLEDLNEVFAIIKKLNNDNNFKEILEGPICHSSFERLN